MDRPVPSLSASGWVNTVAEKADALMANYVTSEYLQTHIYKGEVTSLPYHIAKYGNDPPNLERVVQKDLVTYLSRYFDMVEVEVTTDQPDVDDPERINLQINVSVSLGDKKYDIGREIRTVNNKVVKIFGLNNEG